MAFSENIKEYIPSVITYRGTSMYPALRESDILRIYKDSGYIPSRGDVILFEHPENKNPVVHRIIEIEGSRFYTKGDNSHEADPWVLKRSDIKGTVVQIWRNKRTIHIFKNKNYLQRSTTIYQQLLNLTWPLYMFIRPVYKSAALKGIFYNFLPSRLKPRPVIFTSENIVKLCLFINKTYVARYDTTQKQWFIKPPFRFAVSQECMDKARLDFEKHLLSGQNS